MSKIAIEFDTLDKTLNVTVDGEKLEDVSSINIYEPWSMDGDNDDDDETLYRCCISLGEHDKEKKIRKYTQIVASSENPDGAPSKVNGFRLAPSKVEQDIQSYLAGR